MNQIFPLGLHPTLFLLIMGRVLTCQQSGGRAVRGPPSKGWLVWDDEGDDGWGVGEGFCLLAFGQKGHRITDCHILPIFLYPHYRGPLPTCTVFAASPHTHTHTQWGVGRVEVRGRYGGSGGGGPLG